MDNKLVEKLRKLDDEKWLNLLIRASEATLIEDIEMPAFPMEAVQSQFVGSARADALKEAFRFFSYVKTLLSSHGDPLHARSRVLDFGCGWGRFLRLFMKDIDPDALYGIDVDPDVIGFCKMCGIPAQFGVVSPLGPTSFPDASFNLIYAYSVFSHLSENAANTWIRELRRILVPGGYLILTTERRWFITYAATLRNKNNATLSGWHRALASAFENPDEALTRYDAGEFVFVPTGGGDYRDKSFYGEAVIGQKYIERAWCDSFNLVDWIDDGTRFWQAVAALRAK